MRARRWVQNCQIIELALRMDTLATRAQIEKPVGNPTGGPTGIAIILLSANLSASATQLKWSDTFRLFTFKDKNIYIKVEPGAWRCFFLNGTLNLIRL